MARQHGAISRSQGRDAGLTRHQVSNHVTGGRWRRPARGVYVSAAAPETTQQRAVVACLAGPPGTVASHETAALFGLRPAPQVPHVTIPRSASGRQGGAIVHHSNLDPADTCTVDRVPATTPARTLVDCAAILDLEDLCDLVDAAFHRRLVKPSAVRRAMARSGRAPGRQGLRRLEEAMEVWVCGVRPGSAAEVRTLRCLNRWGLPVPERQYEIRDAGGRLVAKADFAWPDRMALLEYDGEEHHGPRDWAADADREARLESLGWTIERADRFDLRPSSTRLREALSALLRKSEAA